MALDAQENDTASKDICIAVPRLSRIANFDDLDPLSAEPDVTMVIVEAGDPLPCSADLILIPGTKATVADLEYIRAQGWDIDIAAHVRRGGMVVGLCGGYQILGKRISDPIGIEGAIGEKEGLGLLDVETVLGSDKTLEIVSGVHIASGEKIHGYEIHIGSSEGPDRSNPWICLDDKRVEGALSQDGRVMGSYIHGIFASDGFRQFFLEGLHKGRTNTTAYEMMVENTLDNLAEHLEENMDLDALYAVTKK